MNPNRRRLLLWGGGLAALAHFGSVSAAAGDTIEISMSGRKDGSHVWFNPIGLLIQRGQWIRWINRDSGNSHTVTAYHAGNFDRPRRMPENAAPWDSGLLLPGETFEWKFTERGVYDYYCIPHEHAGMVGRIVVEGPEEGGWTEGVLPDGDLPEVALSSFPPVDRILREGVIQRG